LRFSPAAEPAHPQPRRPATRDAIPVSPQWLPVCRPRLQLEHLTLLNHLRTSSIGNQIEESHPHSDHDHPAEYEVFCWLSDRGCGSVGTRGRDAQSLERRVSDDAGDVSPPAGVGGEDKIAGTEAPRCPVADFDVDGTTQHDYPRRRGCWMWFAMKAAN
jgi:hypothetical protein